MEIGRDLEYAESMSTARRAYSSNDRPMKTSTPAVHQAIETTEHLLDEHAYSLLVGRLDPVVCHRPVDAPSVPSEHPASSSLAARIFAVNDRLATLRDSAQYTAGILEV